MIGARLYYLAETKEWFSKTQAGFRKQQCTEDQILRIVQAVSDGFQERPASRTAMVMIDYSKAYDRVWQEDLLLEMLEKGVPMLMVRWIRAFLTDRSAFVLYNGSYSRKTYLRQGLPQGSVLAPLLFLFYINNLSDFIQTEGVENALFADDASLWAQDTDLNRANSKLQEALDRVVTWSESKKMVINIKKCEATFFTSSPAEAKWRPTLTLGAKNIEYESSPKFLGVHLDRTLAFTTHVEAVTKKVRDRCKMLASLSSKRWGWKKKNLRTVYITSLRSVMDYAGSSWQPWLSPTQMKKLETAQNKALRLITGQYSSTPIEALRAEAEIESYTTHSKKLSLVAAEKAERLGPDHPRNRALSPSKMVVHRSKMRSSWREEVSENRKMLLKPMEDLEKKPIASPFTKPWTEGNSQINWSVFTEVPDKVIEYDRNGQWEITPWGQNIKKLSSLNDAELRVEKCVRILDEYQIETTIYTDGSCTAGTDNGGSAAVVTTGTARNPVVIESIAKKGGKFTCSFVEEHAAMMEAVNWIVENQKHDDTIICTDSRSLLQSIESELPDTNEIRKGLQSVSGHTYLHYVPGHINIPGNEIADRAAKDAAKMECSEEEGNVPISFEVAKAVVKRVVKDPSPQHRVVVESYRNYSKKREKAIANRKDAALLAQLRSGHCLELAAYRNRIDPTKSPTCPHCELEDETVVHWIQCPATANVRQEVFGAVDVPLGVLTSKPNDSLTFAKITFNLF